MTPVDPLSLVIVQEDTVARRQSPDEGFDCAASISLRVKGMWGGEAYWRKRPGGRGTLLCLDQAALVASVGARLAGKEGSRVEPSRLMRMEEGEMTSERSLERAAPVQSVL